MCIRDRLLGVGAVTAARLRGAGMRTIGDVAERSRQALEALLGNHGHSLYEYVHGLEQDVYKRQRKGGGNKKIIAIYLQERKGGKQNEKTAVISTVGSPVSYTHLDVYKRQCLSRGLARLAAPKRSQKN